MTTYTGSVFTKGLWGAVTDAEFRLWGQACQNAIAGAGLTQVSSTVNWATTTVPTNASTFNANDTATYKFNDGGTEIYLKFDWGRGSATTNAINQFALRVQMGADAAMAQSTTAVYACGGWQTAAISDYAWHASFSDGCFVLTEVSGVTNTYNPITVFVERSRSASGAVNNNAAMLCIGGNSVNSATSSTTGPVYTRRMVFSPFATTATYGTGLTHLSQTVLTALTSNTDSVVPFVWGYNGVLSPMRSILVATTSVGALQNVTITDGGTTRQYRSGCIPAGGLNALTASNRPIYRWE